VVVYYLAVKNEVISMAMKKVKGKRSYGLGKTLIRCAQEFAASLGEPLRIYVELDTFGTDEGYTNFTTLAWFRYYLFFYPVDLAALQHSLTSAMMEDLGVVDKNVHKHWHECPNVAVDRYVLPHNLPAKHSDLADFATTVFFGKKADVIAAIPTEHWKLNAGFVRWFTNHVREHNGQFLRYIHLPSHPPTKRDATDTEFTL